MTTNGLSAGIADGKHVKTKDGPGLLLIGGRRVTGSRIRFRSSSGTGWAVNFRTFASRPQRVPRLDDLILRLDRVAAAAPAN
jgi:hypothetical protein